MFIAKSVSERILKIGEYLVKLQAITWLSHALRAPGQCTANMLLANRQTESHRQTNRQTDHATYVARGRIFAPDACNAA